MLRFALFAAVALTPAPALAQPPVPPQPPAPAGVRLLDAKVDKGKVIWSEKELVPITEEVAVKVNVNGMEQIEKRTVVVYKEVQVMRAEELKRLKATDASGKTIAADTLAELLKETTPVVVVTGSLPDKHRALFKDKTVFVELPVQARPVVPVPVPPKL